MNLLSVFKQLYVKHEGNYFVKIIKLIFFYV